MSFQNIRILLPWEVFFLFELPSLPFQLQFLAIETDFPMGVSIFQNHMIYLDLAKKMSE